MTDGALAIRWWILERSGQVASGVGYSAAMRDAARLALGAAFVHPNGMTVMVAGGVDIILTRQVDLVGGKTIQRPDRWGFSPLSDDARMWWDHSGAMGLGANVPEVTTVADILRPHVRGSQPGG